VRSYLAAVAAQAAYSERVRSPKAAEYRATAREQPAPAAGSAPAPRSKQRHRQPRQWRRPWAEDVRSLCSNTAGKAKAQLRSRGFAKAAAWGEARAHERGPAVLGGTAPKRVEAPLRRGVEGKLRETALRETRCNVERRFRKKLDWQLKRIPGEKSRTVEVVNLSTSKKRRAPEHRATNVATERLLKQRASLERASRHNVASESGEKSNQHTCGKKWKVMSRRGFALGPVEHASHTEPRTALSGRNIHTRLTLPARADMKGGFTAKGCHGGRGHCATEATDRGEHPPLEGNKKPS